MRCLTLFVAALLLCPAGFVRAELQPVGTVTRNYTDPARRNWENTGPRPLNTVIWYPAAPGTKTGTDWAGADVRKLFVVYPLAPDAGLAPNAKCPVLLISHGSTGQALGHSWLGFYFAARGYIVAAVNHHGDTSAEKQLMPQGFFFRGERARDLSAVLDQLIHDPVFGPHVDSNRVVAAGHSSGGETIIQLAGGIYNPANFQVYCASDPKAPDCSPPPQVRATLDKIPELAKSDPLVKQALARQSQPVKDPRVKAIFSMAPAVGIAYTKETLSGVTVPVHIVVGDADDITPAASNAQRFANFIPGAKITILPKANHMVFGSECMPAGVEKFGFCRDPEGVDRVAIHRQVEALAEDLFERALDRQH